MSKRKSLDPPLTLYVFEHPDCGDHDTYNAVDGTEHQESAARLPAIRERLETMKGVVFTSNFPPASIEAMQRVHSDAYLKVLSSVEQQYDSGTLNGTRPLSPHVVPALFPGAPVHGMTLVSRGSLRAARRAAGSVIAAIDAVLENHAARKDDRTPPVHAFCLVRPPGHHAMVDGYDPVAGGCGFCLLNNIAIGAAHAISCRGLKVAIVDFDVRLARLLALPCHS